MDRMQTSKLSVGRRLGSRKRQLDTVEMNMGMGGWRTQRDDCLFPGLVAV